MLIIWRNPNSMGGKSAHPTAAVKMLVAQNATRAFLAVLPRRVVSFRSVMRYSMIEPHEREDVGQFREAQSCSIRQN